MNAHAHDTIDLTHLACSKITLQNGALTSSVPVTIEGPGADKLSIDAANLSRVISASDDLTLTGLTLENGGVADYGGCVFAQEALTIQHSILTNCHVTDGVARGGAIRVVGEFVMSESVISDSSAVSSSHDARGGAIYAYAAAKINNTTLSNNLAKSGNGLASGGAIFVHADLQLFQTRIDGNVAKSASGPAYGGAIHTPVSATIGISRSIITNNLSHSESNWSYGGGISSGRYGSALPATVGIGYSTVSHNTAESNCSSCIVSGGGIHAVDSITSQYSTIDNNKALCGRATSSCVAGGGGLAIFGNRNDSVIGMINSTVSSNQAIGGTAASASGFGGGIAIVSSADRVLEALNSTVAFNHASKSGGGIAWQSTMSQLLNTIVANNETDSASNDIARGPMGTVALNIVGSNNIVMLRSNATVPADTRTGDPLLLPLANNGGPTQTHALGGGSIAVDHGIGGFNLGCDQRGWPYEREIGTAPDIGAFEAQDLLLADGFDGPVSC